MYNSLISLVPLLLWLIPCGSKGFLYTLLRSSQYNSTLLDEGIFMLITAGFLFAVIRVLTIKTNNKDITQLPAVVVGMVAFLIAPLGFSFIGVVFSVLLIFGIKTKQPLNYTLYIGALHSYCCNDRASSYNRRGNCNRRIVCACQIAQIFCKE